MHSSSYTKIIRDWHLAMVVLLFVLVDVVILTIVSCFDSARFKPTYFSDVEHSDTYNVHVCLCVCQIPNSFTHLCFAG